MLLKRSLRAVRWFFHKRIGRVVPLRWNHRVTIVVDEPTSGGVCACGWIMPGGLS